MYSPRPLPPVPGSGADGGPDITEGQLLIVNNEWHCMDLLTARYTDVLAGEDRVTAVGSIKVSAVRALDENELSWVRSREFDYAVVGMGH
jgi:hypothetical protein